MLATIVLTCPFVILRSFGYCFVTNSGGRPCSRISARAGGVKNCARAGGVKGGPALPAKRRGVGGAASSTYGGRASRGEAGSGCALRAGRLSAGFPGTRSGRPACMGIGRWRTIGGGEQLVLTKLAYSAAFIVLILRIYKKCLRNRFGVLTSSLQRVAPSPSKRRETYHERISSCAWSGPEAWGRRSLPLISLK